MKFCKFFRLLLLIALPVAVLLSGQAQAQTNVSIRGGNHEEYSRLVFDWPMATNYDISKSADKLTITFDKAAAASLSDLNGTSLKNIGSVDVTSAAGGNLALSIKIKPASEYRHFKIGSRVIVDVYDAPGTLDSKIGNIPMETPAKADKTAESTPPPPAQSELKAATSGQNLTAKEISPTVVSEPKMATTPAPEPEVQPAPKLKITGMQPHLIKVTATQTVGMAAFERAGYLWIVLDDPEMKVPPVLAGPNADEFPPVEKIQLNNGTAYRMPLPEGYKFYGEGGGLEWRLVITPNPRRTVAMKPETEHDGGVGAMGGGTLIWPMATARKVIAVKDPLLSDDIYVVTADNSSEYAGDQRQYVELEILPSFVGIAMVPKADDLEVSLKSKKVRITRPSGLALSSERDTAAVVLKDDIQKEEEAFEEEEKTDRMTTIFDFDRWEMGGIKSLEENRRIIMRGIGNKEGHGKVEDLITLAKLNVANDRGQEALGLLRVAAKELPGIEENPEYIALRGAAGALAGKDDEAIEDLASLAVEPYEEVKYWKAFALAGLEDWRQANEVMPSDMEVLLSYPEQIKEPIALALAEVSLRAGDTEAANFLLGVLEPNFEVMSLSRRSNWSYLNGELARQNGNPDAALEEWQKLVNGKDDYFRAKAGLSLTKLQLERQKITPEKAIDRLEGLRYAWRGDELETLINYRLGEVYINNNDYLKGLSVLRNAISLSPNSIMSQEVTDYMTTTFRDLFTKDKLKDVSPLDAVTIYDEFKELTPIGSEGDVFIQKLAERLVSVDLLGRASALLEHQLDHRLKGADAVPVGIRLAAIRLLDGKPEAAMGALRKAEDALRVPSTVASKTTSAQKREINLLRARALSKLNKAGQALSILNSMSPDTDVVRLKADVAWNAGMWEDAAEAFQDLIIAENISLTRPMNEYQTNLILNRSIALNLAGNRVAISNLRERYGDLMAQSDKAQLFDLVTRPRQLGLLSNKDSVSSLISEVDLFGDFLENYKKIN